MTNAPCLWSFDYDCLDKWDDYDPADRDLATSQASDLMFTWTLGLYGGCPITMRPGHGCGCGSYTGICQCGGSTDLWLPMPVGSVDIVEIDGVALDPSVFRLEAGQGGYWLVRQDGEVWPSQQTLSLPLGDVGTWAITVTPGWPISPAGKRAGAILASELVKLSTPGQKCRLPERVTNLVRQGVSMELEPTDFARGVTGIREIDLYLAVVNPERISRAPSVYSPDLPQFREKMWP